VEAKRVLVGSFWLYTSIIYAKNAGSPPTQPTRVINFSPNFASCLVIWREKFAPIKGTFRLLPSWPPLGKHATFDLINFYWGEH